MKDGYDRVPVEERRRLFNELRPERLDKVIMEYVKGCGGQYLDEAYWRRFEQVYNPKKCVSVSSPYGYEPPTYLLAAGIAAARLPEKKLREWFKKLGKNFFYFDREDLTKKFDLTKEEVENDKIYRQVIDSIPEDDLRRGLIILVGIDYKKDGRIRPHAEIEDAYELAKEYYREALDDPGFRNSVVGRYHGVFCKPIGYRDEIEEICRKIDSKAPVIAYEAGTGIGKYVAELLTLVGGTVLGSQILSKTPLGDISQKIFQDVLKEAPDLAANSSFMDMVISSQTILPIIASALLAGAAALYIGKKIEEGSAEAAVSMEERQRERFWQEVEEMKDVIYEEIEKGFEILKSKPDPTVNPQ